MSDDSKRILNPFTGPKKRKAWNKTKEKYLPVQQTGDNIAKRNGQENFQTVKVHFTMVMKVIMVMRVIMKIMNSSSYWRVLPTAAIQGTIECGFTLKRVRNMIITFKCTVQVSTHNTA